MFEALLSVDDFIAEAMRQATKIIHIQTSTRADRIGGVRTAAHSYLIVTALGEGEGAAARILVARIHVESVDLVGGDENQRTQALARRLDQAHGHLSDHLASNCNALIAPGILLHPGVLEEIQKIDSSHRLWTWKNGRDPIARELEYLDRPF